MIDCPSSECDFAHVQADAGVESNTFGPETSPAKENRFSL
jgi:hypothetical protein